MSISILNTDANLTAKTVMAAENADTVTGLKTFDRDPSAPFAVSSSSAVVPNLDADKVDGFDVVGWTAFTPTWTSLTIGNATTNTGKYMKVGNGTFFRIDLVWGNTTAITGNVTINFPVTAAIGSSFTVCHGEAIDASTGDTFGLHGRLTSSTAFAMFTDNGTKLIAVAAATPFVWTTSDEFHIIGFFESA